MPAVTEMLIQVRDILDEATSSQWSNSQLKRWLNEGNRDLARSTRHLKGSKTVTMVASTSEYTMDPDVVAIEHAWFMPAGDTRAIPLIPRHMEQMDSVWGQYRDQSSSYPCFLTTWGHSPTLVMRLFPVPSASSDTVRVLVARLPVEITVNDNATDATTVDTVAIWYDALVDYCEYRALRKDRDPRWQEAWNVYTQKRDGLINNPDYLSVNREVIADPFAGYLPSWLVSQDRYDY